MVAYALLTFIAVNLLGFALVGARAVLRWVSEGFTPGKQ